MRLFWSKGYQATSLQNLLEAMQLSKSSLYQSFGSKPQLFDQCIEHYCETQAECMLEQLQNSPSARQFIEDTFNDIAINARTRAVKKGCLLMNAASEFGQTDARIAAQIDRGMSRFFKVFLTGVKRAQKEGAITADRNPIVLANYLVTSMSGLKTMVKAGMEPEKLTEIVRVILTALD